MFKISITVFFSCLVFITGYATAHADPIDNTQCRVLSSGDSVDSFNTLRRKIEDGFNREENRTCTERISFEPFQEFDILAQDTYEINNPNDGDFNGDAYNLTISGYLADVVIDGTGLDHDQCLFDIYTDKVLFKNLTVRVYDKDFAFCEHASGAEFHNVTIIETKPKWQKFREKPLWMQVVK